MLTIHMEMDAHRMPCIPWMGERRNTCVFWWFFMTVIVCVGVVWMIRVGICVTFFFFWWDILPSLWKVIYNIMEWHSFHVDSLK